MWYHTHHKGRKTSNPSPGVSADSTTYITCPADPKKTLGIKLPFLVMIIKNLKKYFTFEVQVRELDSGCVLAAGVCSLPPLLKLVLLSVDCSKPKFYCGVSRNSTQKKRKFRLEINRSIWGENI